MYIKILVAGLVPHKVHWVHSEQKLRNDWSERHTPRLVVDLDIERYWVEDGDIAAGEPVRIVEEEPLQVVHHIDWNHHLDPDNKLH